MTTSYEFPVIKHIDDVLPHIEGCNDFVVAERDGYTIINYVVESPDTFPDISDRTSMIRRECRGITFGADGKIIRRPLHKFFNISQRNETLPEHINLFKPHIMMTKEDGSLIAPFLVDNKIIWGTKMAAMDFHEAVDAFVGDNHQFRNEVRYMLLTGRTPMYEWTGPDNQIVLKYDKPELRLIAIRNMIDGSYYSMKHDLVTDIQNPVTYWDPWNPRDPHALVEKVSKMTGIEGFVIRFDDGHMVKVKCEEYVLIHRAKDKILFDRHIIDMYYNNLLDDVLPFLNEKEQESVNGFVSTYLAEIKNLAEIAAYEYYRHVMYNRDKRDYAIFSGDSDYGPKNMLRSIIFKMYDGHDHLDTITTMAKKSLNSNVNFERFCDEYLNGIRRVK